MISGKVPPVPVPGLPFPHFSTVKESWTESCFPLTLTSFDLLKDGTITWPQNLSFPLPNFFLSPSKSFITPLLLYSNNALNGLPTSHGPSSSDFHQWHSGQRLKKCFIPNPFPVQNPALLQNQSESYSHTYLANMFLKMTQHGPSSQCFGEKMVWESGSTAFKSRHVHLLVWKTTGKFLNLWACIKWPGAGLLLHIFSIFSFCCHYFLYHYVPTLIYCPILYSVVLPKGRSPVLSSPLT